MKFAIFLMTLVTIISFGEAEAQGRRILKPLEWREAQILDAQNRLVRIRNKITRVRQTTGHLEEVARLEREQSAAAHSIELIGDFTVEDYFDMYLSRYAQSESDLVEVAKGMSKNDVAQLLRAYFKRVAAGTAASTASPVITGLAGAPQPGT